MSRNNFRISRHALLVFAWLAIIAAGAIIQLSPSFALRISELPTNGLEPIGQVISSNGFARRRLATDAVWLSVPPQWAVYRFDRLFTGESARFDLEFQQGTKLALLEDSLIQLDSRDGVPLIDLKQGKIEVLKPGAQGLIVRLDKEVKTIRKDAPPTLVSQQNGHLEVSELQPKAEPEVVSGDPTPAPTPAPAEATTATPEPTAQENSNRLAYPANGTFLYRQKTRSLRVSPGGHCSSTCHVSLFYNGELIAQRTFDPGARPELEVDISLHGSGDFKMDLFDGQQSVSSSFFIRIYSEKALEEALNRSAKIEILK